MFLTFKKSFFFAEKDFFKLSPHLLFSLFKKSDSTFKKSFSQQKKGYLKMKKRFSQKKKVFYFLEYAYVKKKRKYMLFFQPWMMIN